MRNEIRELRADELDTVAGGSLASGIVGTVVTIWKTITTSPGGIAGTGVQGESIGKDHSNDPA
jgi:hypothetical protein